MVPLDTAAAREVITRLGPPAAPGLLALRHALAFRRPGLWGDVPARPRSVILVRQGDGGQQETFGAGDPEPAVGWLVGLKRAFTLLAPETWHEALEGRVGEVERGEVETWSGGSRKKEPTPSRVFIRQLTFGDSAAFNASAPEWGLRGWRSFSAMIDHGAAFGVPDGSGFAALAWVFDQADPYDALGVFTDPRYRRLGLGRAAASALSKHIIDHRRRVPLWSTGVDNEPSRGLARALGFSPVVTEPILRWTPRIRAG